MGGKEREREGTEEKGTPMGWFTAHLWNLEKYPDCRNNLIGGGGNTNVCPGRQLPSRGHWGHRASAQKISWRSVQRFQRYARGQTDRHTHTQTNWSQYSVIKVHGASECLRKHTRRHRGCWLVQACIGSGRISVVNKTCVRCAAGSRPATVTRSRRRKAERNNYRRSGTSVMGLMFSNMSAVSILAGAQWSI